MVTKIQNYTSGKWRTVTMTLKDVGWVSERIACLAKDTGGIAHRAIDADTEELLVPPVIYAKMKTKIIWQQS